MDIETVRSIILLHFNEPCIDVEHMTFGHSNVTYLATLATYSVVVRTNRSAGIFGCTARNMRSLREIGLPIPEVIAVHDSQDRYPFSYMLVEALSGRDLRFELSSMTLAQMTIMAEQIAGYQRLANRLPNGTGFGYANIGEEAAFSLWRDVVLREINLQPNNPIIKQSWRARCTDLFHKLTPMLNTVKPICFLDDITGKNVIVEHGELRGLVDFDCVCYGDPLWWLSLTIVGIVSDLSPRQRFYGEELVRLWDLTPFQRDAVLPFYCAVMAIQFYGRDARTAERLWIDAMTRQIEHWLEMAENAATNRHTPTT